MNVRKLYLPFDFGTLDTVIELTLTKNIYKKFKELFSLYISGNCYSCFLNYIHNSENYAVVIQFGSEFI